MCNVIFAQCNAKSCTSFFHLLEIHSHHSAASAFLLHVYHCDTVDHVYNTVEYIVPRIITYAHDLVLPSPEPHGISATSLHNQARSQSFLKGGSKIIRR